MREDKIKELYSRIFGDKITSLNYKRNPTEITKKTNSKDKCLDCGISCKSFKDKQDLPYFKSLENIETFVIAEAPGSGNEKGEIGYVFGWELFNSNEPKHSNITKYENYFFNILKLERETTYITDAIKCYTHKNDFKSVFSNCKNYLKEEIEILKPKKVLVISKQGALNKFLIELKNSIPFELEIIPHPSPQNISKIKTVSDIFKSLGNISENSKWEILGGQIEIEYQNLIKILKEKK
jgi:uracil-DNA glycosylase family 4